MYRTDTESVFCLTVGEVREMAQAVLGRELSEDELAEACEAVADVFGWTWWDYAVSALLNWSSPARSS